MLRRAAGALILALAIAVTSSVAFLGGPASEGDSSRMREIEALLERTRQASALCTSAPSPPKRQSNVNPSELLGRN